MIWNLTPWRIPHFNFLPQITKVKADTIILTSADTSPWDVPSDFNTTNTIEVIGAGGGGGGGGSGGGQDEAGGGGGGAYSRITNLSLTPGGTVDFQIGTSGAGGSRANDGGLGGDTWLDGSGATCSAQSICAKGGGGGKTGANGAGGGNGGLNTASIGTLRRSGGAGGSAAVLTVGGGGGGAAGDTGDGGTDTDGNGGVGGGSGTASGGSPGNPGGAGTDGTEWTSAGSGGGGGGGDKGDGGPGGQDGGGAGGADRGKVGGVGGEGVIIITYTPVASSASFTQFEYRWWTDTPAVVPVGPWGTPDLAKNTPIVFNNEALVASDIIRLRISLSNATGDCGINCDTYKLRFVALGSGESCSSATYTDVATDGACSGAWCVDNNTSYADEAAVSDCAVGGNNCISTANIEQEVEDSNNSFDNPIAITSSEDGEWDINLNATSSLAYATEYCFKVTKSGGGDLDGGYTNYPQLISVPGISNLMRHGNFFNSVGVEQGFYWSN